ncbi:DUF4073 domain-containing protein [Clostridium oceanicum]|uniref:F5/8 type C domain-containing protein n=1 Tax=Clostridium oceanicum TaxID=1543 RepID=A0ABP3UZJ7_9CLOT
MLKKTSVFLLITLVSGSLGSFNYVHAAQNSKVNLPSSAIVQANSQYTQSLQSIKSQINTKVNGTNELEGLLQDSNFKNNLVKYQFLTRLGENNFNSFQNNVELKSFLNDLLKNTYIMNGLLMGRTLNYTEMGNAVKILKNIWEDDKECHSGFYLKLAIATAMGHSKPIRTYDYKREVINPVVRYNHYKNLYKQGKLFENFDKYDIVHLSMIVNNPGSDSDIDWMQEYIRKEKPTYVNQDQIKRAAFLVPYGPKKRGDGRSYRTTKWTLKDTLTMAGVCGRLSHFGSIAVRAFGAPSSMIDQPGHRAFLHLQTKNSWRIGNNIGGLGGTKFNGETLIPWGNHAAYLFLMEEASLDQEALEKSYQLYWLSNIVSSDSKAKAIRDEAIKVQPLNYFSWKDKISALLKDSNASKDQFEKLSVDIMNTFYNHPKVMDDLLKLIKDKAIAGDRVSLQEYIINYNNALKKCTDSMQQTVIKKLKEQFNKDHMYLARFSFTGENAGRLMGAKTDVEYSIDGGKTYNFVKEENQKLTDSEIKSLTSENGILLRVKGSESFIRLSLIKGSQVTNVFGSDNLDIITGLDESMEFSIDEGKTWTKYKKHNAPDLSGDLVMYVRKSAKDTVVAGEKRTFKFTKNTASKILIDNFKITIANVSSQNTDKPASNVIDNDQFSAWRTNAENVNKEKFITLKLNQVTKISRLDYLRDLNGGNQGNIRQYNVYTSLDGVNFTRVSGGRWSNDNRVKTSTFKPVDALYVKLKATGVVKGYAAASSIRLYKVDEKPVINAENLSFYKGDEINFDSILSKVTATDKEDGDLTSKITYTTNYVKGEAGDYEIVYKVTDSYGNETTKKVILKVKERYTYASDLPWIKATTQVGRVEKDRSTKRRTLRLWDGEKEISYKKGLGTHSNSEVIYNLEKENFKYFTSNIGVDRTADSRGSVKFKVFADGKLLYESEVMKRDTASKFIKFDIEGVKEFKLVVEDGGNGRASDHANWANAKFIMPDKDVVSGDTSKLQEVIKEVEGLKSSDYEKTFWDNLQEKITEGKLLLTKEKAKQSEIDKAVEDIKTALSNLKKFKGENPVINATDLSFYKGDEINFDFILSKVTALDKEDGNISSKVTYTTNYVKDKVGEFEVVYTAVDSHQNKTVKKVKLRVEEKETKEEFVYASDLAWTKATTQWRSVQKDKSIKRRTLRLWNGEKEVSYKKGIGTHSNSEVIYNIEGKDFKQFKSVIGVNRTADSRGSVKFKVFVDGKLLYTSEVMKRNTASESIEVDVEGAKEIKLVVENGGNGNASDHANWADAKFIK